MSLTKTYGTPVTPALSPGTTLAGKYSIRREIGRGGMGIVYEAEDIQLKRTVALKFLSPDLALDPGHRKLFTREAQTASALNHPNICTVYEVGEAGGDSYIAMEYIEGRPLDSLIPSEGLPAGLRAVIQKCLEKDLGKRFQAVSEVRKALEAFAHLTGSGPTDGTSRPWPKWGSWTLFAAGLCIAGILIMILSPKNSLKRGIERSQAALSTGARASPNPDANDYFEKGMLFLKAQFDLPRARTMLEKALEFDPKFAEARAWYGFTFVLEIDSGYSNDTNWLYKAEQELRQALRDDAKSARAHSGLAASYFYQGRKELAFEEAKRALEIDPNEIDAINWLSNYYESNGDYASANNLLYPMLQRDPLLAKIRDLPRFRQILESIDLRRKTRTGSK